MSLAQMATGIPHLDPGIGAIDFSPATGSYFIHLRRGGAPIRIPRRLLEREYFSAADLIRLIEDELAARKAAQLFADQRHDRGWPKQ